MFTRRGFARSLAAAAMLSGGWALPALAQDDDDSPPNVFISPCGKPYRALITDPYPVVVWFKETDKDADGKIDHKEFLADAEAFFKVLDANGDGVIASDEITLYERTIAPEILGYRVRIKGPWRPVGRDGAKLWLAQTPSGYDSGSEGDAEANPFKHGPKDVDESGQGASPYSFFYEPEPVMAADENLNGIIRKDAFLRLAGRHFDKLDKDGRGFLTLDRLPKTDMQVRVERYQARHHR
jgi:hypothetical protein